MRLFLSFSSPPFECKYNDFYLNRNMKLQKYLCQEKSLLFRVVHDVVDQLLAYPLKLHNGAANRADGSVEF